MHARRSRTAPFQDGGGRRSLFRNSGNFRKRPLVDAENAATSGRWSALLYVSGKSQKKSEEPPENTSRYFSVYLTGELHPLFFRERLHAELGGLAGLGAGVLAHEDKRRLLRDRVGDLGAQLLGARLSRIAGHGRELAGEDDDLVLERRVGGDHAALHGLYGKLLQQVPDDVDRVALGEEGAQ